MSNLELSQNQSNLLVFPLAALVGQQKMVQALLILAVDPALGGLLLSGEKGTAKSTAARALAELLPPHRVVANCPNHCSTENEFHLCPNCLNHLRSEGSLPWVESPAPFHTVPLGVTEDRLLGGLDWENTLTTGKPTLALGILGQAHGGLVYIDEVNLLDVSLAHLMLDAVSAGKVTLEREGISTSCPTKVALLGTMNPEEGPLGPQLADRFALSVDLVGETDPALRAEVVRRRLEFEQNPLSFRLKYAKQTEALTQQIAEAKKFLPQVTISETAQELISRLAVGGRLAGHRGDLALARAARAKAALLGKSIVNSQDVLDISPLVLTNRTRPAPAKEQLGLRLVKAEKAEEQAKLFEQIYVSDAQEIPPEFKEGGGDGPVEDHALQIFNSAEEFKVITPQSRREVGPRGRSGRRHSRESIRAEGRAVGTTARRLGRPLSLASTLRAAAPYQRARQANSTEKWQPLILKPIDFREKVYRQKTGRLVVFVVDSSGSIGTLYRMEEAKAAALALLAEAYQKRDRVALIVFYGQRAELLLPPTNSPDLAARLLSELPSGGKTPLAAALVLTRKLLTVEQAKDPALTPYIVLMTDGRPNIPLAPGVNPWTEALTLAGLMAEDPQLRFLLIDTDRGAYNDYKLTYDLAQKLRAPRINLEELREGKLQAWLDKINR